MAKEFSLKFDQTKTETKNDLLSFIFRQIEKVNANAKSDQFRLSFLNTKSQQMLF
jgi:hypothetical protein